MIPNEQEVSPVVQELTPPFPRTFLERHGISPILFAFLSLIIVFLLYQIIGGLLTILFFGLKPTPNNVIGFRFGTGLAQILFLLVPTLLLVRFASFRPKEYLRIRSTDVKMLIIPFVGIFSLQQILQIYLVFQEKIPLPESIEKINQQFKQLFEEAYKLLAGSHSLQELLIVIVIVALIPAVCEELLFRGLVMRSFEEGLGSGRGVMLSGVIFGAYHLNPFTFIPLAILGVYLGFIAYRANSVWVSAAAHFYNNAFACIALYLQWDDDAVVTGNPNDMSLPMLLATLWFFGVIFLVSTYYFIHLTKQRVTQEEIEVE